MIIDSESILAISFEILTSAKPKIPNCHPPASGKPGAKKTFRNNHGQYALLCSDTNVVNFKNLLIVLLSLTEYPLIQSRNYSDISRFQLIFDASVSSISAFDAWCARTPCPNKLRQLPACSDFTSRCSLDLLVKKGKPHSQT